MNTVYLTMKDQPFSLEMIEYLANYKEFERLSSELKSISERLKTLRDRQLDLGNLLAKSVQPVCGSAHRPHVRSYTDGTYTTLIVHWDDKLQRGRLSVTSQ